jgi:hypothetical protein
MQPESTDVRSGRLAGYSGDMRTSFACKVVTP